MTYKKILKGGFLPLFFLFLTSCSCSGPWIYKEIERNYPPGTSALLSYVPNDKYYGIELDFMKGDFGQRATVGISCRTIPPLEGASSFSPLWIYVDGRCTPFALHRLKGGQRLDLSPEATSLLLTSLLNGREVAIQMIGFKSEYPIGNFATQYAKWATH